MVASEDALIETLQDSAKVDGHDVGSDETNIFIFTLHPQKTFERAKHRLPRRRHEWGSQPTTPRAVS